MKTRIAAVLAGAGLALAAQAGVALAHAPHEVAPGDMLWRISEDHYGSSQYVWEIARYNGIEDPDLIYVGDVLELPAVGELVAGRAAVGGAPAAAPAPAPQPAPQPAAQPVQNTAPANQSPPAFSGGFIWPTTGPISQYFHGGHPAIDISQAHQPGAPVVASAPGVVSFAGGDPSTGYGYWVEIEHAGGYTTRYAHFSYWPAVSVGQQVSAGQLIGYNGRTGWSTGYHVHFEIRRHGTPLNPCAFLGC